jgi:hypothetical protein
MGKVVMAVLGALLGAFVLFTFVLPLLGVLLKVALIIAVVGVVFFIAVNVVGKSSRSQ